MLGGVSADAGILQEEIFGPVAPIVTFDNDDEAIALANDTVYGLASYLYTGDLARGLRVAEAIESGMVGLNRGLVSDPAAPFGGVKHSGIGREGSHEGMDEYLETKYIAVNWYGRVAEGWSTSRTEEIARVSLRFLYPTSQLPTDSTNSAQSCPGGQRTMRL